MTDLLTTSCRLYYGISTWSGIHRTNVAFFKQKSRNTASAVIFTNNFSEPWYTIIKHSYKVHKPPPEWLIRGCTTVIPRAITHMATKGLLFNRVYGLIVGNWVGSGGEPPGMRTGQNPWLRLGWPIFVRRVQCAITPPTCWACKRLTIAYDRWSLVTK